MPDRHPARPVTVVNRFRVGSRPREAAQELAGTAQFLRRQPGFDFLVRAQLAERPDVHLQLGYWRSRSGFLAAVRQPGFTSRVERLAAIEVDTSADQAVSVARVASAGGCHDPREAVGVLVEYVATGDPAACERELRAQAESFLTWPGFGGTDVLRSLVRPYRYLSMSWWFDADERAAALAAASRAAPAAPPTAIRVEPTRRIAYERALPAG